MPTIVLTMWKRSGIMISLFFGFSLFVAPLTNQIDSSLSSFSSSSSNNTTTTTATSHSDEYKCSLNHIFKPNLYNKKPNTANKNTNTMYFYKTTHEGEFPNKVYGLFLCVFGISPRSCRYCVRDAIVIIRQHCHGAKEAILWYDQCLVRYSYRPFFSTLETVPNRCTAASNADMYVGEPANFTKILYQTFLEMIQMATFDTFNKHAIKASNISGSNIILLYTFAQCIPNLSTQDCQVCLNIAVSIIPSCDFQGKKYGSILIPSCYISYELYQFYRIIRVEAPPTPTSPSAHNDDKVRRLFQVGATVPTPTSPAHHDENHQIFRAGARVPATSSTRDKDIGDPTTSHNSKRRSNARIIFLAVGIFIQLLLLLTAYLLCRRKGVPEDNQEFRLNNCQEFSFTTVRVATQNFENQLGQGGFGPVYKGTLASGKKIAVKRLELTRRAGQGRSQFWNEVNLIPRLQHKNIVQLLGYCSEGDEMLLIYEFMSNKSLDAQLFDSTNSQVAPLDWKTRKKISKGIARGLVYLHEDSPLKIIHRDIKSSNVLLDDEMNSKISDFGIAKSLKDNQSEANTTTKVGTYGYMAPEYCMEGVISSKLDVYSFGVVLLEIISGLKSSDCTLGLPSHIWGLWCIGSRIELMDQAMAQSSVDSEEVRRWIHIGLLCVQEDAGKRPYMSEVLPMLENRNITLPEPTRPPLAEDQPNPEASQQSDQPDLEASQQSSCSTIYLDAEAGPCQSSLSVDCQSGHLSEQLQCFFKQHTTST